MSQARDPNLSGKPPTLGPGGMAGFEKDDAWKEWTRNQPLECRRICRFLGPTLSLDVSKTWVFDLPRK